MSRAPLRRSGFSLMEVLFGIAIFGAATAALLSAMAPAYDELHRLSNESATSGDVEVLKAMVEAAPNYSAATQGGDASLPDGRKISWSVALEPTSTEALFLVKLHAAGDGQTFDAEYLHFEPRWLQPGSERPRWLQHTNNSSSNSGGGGGGGTGGGVGPGRGGATPGGATPGGGGTSQGGRPGRPGRGGPGQGGGGRSAPGGGGGR